MFFESRQSTIPHIRTAQIQFLSAELAALLDSLPEQKRGPPQVVYIASRSSRICRPEISYADNVMILATG